ncbi:transmembrane protein 72 [Ambystoma mexicanum]|uniref:transmembrane protein 72 n=1 Tax=Ambystoma mexicanum TaxID=8296 RepID=UPI0037E8E601
MKAQLYWTAMEGVCRFLGISTAAVLTGVGVETLQQGQFPSLAYYLLFSAVAVSICEVTFFLHLLLSLCFSCPSESTLTVCWEKTARMGGFQKFLGYTLLSIACFLHPVLVWHVTIPGTMLIVTGAAYFLLSKKKKQKPVEKESFDQSKEYHDPTATAVSMTQAGDTEQTYTFNSSFKERKASLLTQVKSILKVNREKTAQKAPEGAADQPKASTDNLSKRKQVHFEEKVVQIVPSVAGSLEEPDSDVEEETTSDTAPIIPPRDVHSAASSQPTIGIF